MIEASEIAYKKAALGGASAVSLVVALCDRMASDLTQAAESIQRNDVEERSASIKHALLLLEQLESLASSQPGGDLNQKLCRLYAQIRSRIMQAHVSISSQLLQQQATVMLELRQIWHDLEQPQVAAPPDAPRRGSADGYGDVIEGRVRVDLKA